MLEVDLNSLISLFTFTFDILYPIVKVGHTDDYSHGAVKLSVSLVDKDAMKKISVTPNHSYLSQLDVTYKTPDLMSHFLPP
ncbi:hypothetical protein RQ658_04770, partial [Streptococcus pneumoniae]|nr:hypothetical protein [Streptococcus pneumoniae]